MFNIEVYGIRGDSVDAVIRKRIIGQIRDFTLGNDVIVTVVESVSVDKDSQKIAPFLRICSSDQFQLYALVEKLKPLAMNIEILLLTDFFPKEKTTDGKIFNWFTAAKKKS